MANNMKDLLNEEARRYRLELSEGQIDKFVRYLELIQKWQRSAVRLVGSAEPTELIGKHVADAFALHAYLGKCEGKKLIDIGSGAGFPGMCLKLLEPGLNATLVEASARKASFLSKVRAELALSGVSVVRERAESISGEGQFRERFDLATVRAVAGMVDAIELGLPFLCCGGRLFLVRGATSEEEIETARGVAGRCGGTEVVVHDMSVGGVAGRGSIMIVVKGEGQN
jgi:16S rRNA (guanine527-N7)-methyltransferase